MGRRRRPSTAPFLSRGIARTPDPYMGDVSSATALIATSEEASRELRDGRSGLFRLVRGEASRFAMYIDDEVELALREASGPYAKVGTRLYTCALCPEKTFTQRIRLVRQIQSVHVDSGIRKPATSKTLQLALSLYNRGHLLAGVGIATRTCTPSGGYLARSAALISGWVRECRPKARREDRMGDLTSGRITDVDMHIALCLASRGPSLLPVAYL